MPAWQLTGRPPAVTGPSWRATIVVTATAVGAVATGTFTALLPGDGAPTSADASEGPISATLATEATDLPVETAAMTGFLAPVTLGLDTGEFVDEHLAMLDKASVLAAELAQRQAQEQREAQERAAVATQIAEGGLEGWIAEALQILDLPQSLAPSVRQIIMAESGGNPNAINNWDSNARRGTPSQGLMQTIPSTFQRYVHPDLADEPITDPVANITAGIRYMIDTYGIETLEAGGRTDSSGSYIGY